MAFYDWVAASNIINELDVVYVVYVVYVQSVFCTWKYLFRFRNELSKVLEEEGGRGLVVLDRQRQLGPGIPQHVDGLVVTC